MLPKRVREVLKERARSINSCTLPAIRYSTGIINWPKEKIKATEIKNRKIMIVHGGLCQGHHPGWNDNNLSEHQWDGRSDAVLSENTKTQRRGRGMWTNQKKMYRSLGWLYWRITLAFSSWLLQNSLWVEDQWRLGFTILGRVSVRQCRI